MDDSHSDSSANQRQSRRPRLPRQRSMDSVYSSVVVKSPEEPVNTVVVIPPEEAVNTVVTIPPVQQEPQEPSPPLHEFPSLDEVD
jgi:hypothetical protein